MSKKWLENVYYHFRHLSFATTEPFIPLCFLQHAQKNISIDFIYFQIIMSLKYLVKNVAKSHVAGRVIFILVFSFFNLLCFAGFSTCTFWLKYFYMRKKMFLTISFPFISFSIFFSQSVVSVRLTFVYKLPSSLFFFKQLYTIIKWVPIL